MRVIPKPVEREFNTFLMSGELSGTLFVCLSEPYIQRHFLLTSTPTGLVDLINGTVHPLAHFNDDVIFNKVDGTLTIK